MTCRVLPAFVAVALLAPAASAQLRIVTFNVADDTGSFLAGGPRTGTDGVLTAIGVQSFNGVARPIDILTIQESGGAATTAQAFVNRLNTLYGAGTYARGSTDGITTGAGTQSVIYRTSTVQLVGESAFGTTTGGTGAARQTLRYQFRPAGTGYTSAADFYLYSSHYKANSQSQSDADNAARRSVEAAAIRTNADALGAGTRAIFAGDFNLYGPDEATTGNVPSGYRQLLASGNAQATDPVFSGSGANGWDGNSFRSIHTQSPATTSAYGGQVLGGMNDRFDFALPTTAMASGRGVSLISGTYRAFGNTGTHTLNGAIDTGSVSAFQATLPGYSSTDAAAVLSSLTKISDHIPVVSDYRLPARLDGSLVATTPRVIRGSAATLTLSVSNTAPVAVAVGADTLDYTYAGGTGVTGSGSASGLAFGATANTHTLTLATSAAGTYTGSVSTTATSPQAGNALGTPSATVTALDHAGGSFSNAAPAATSQTVHFGNVTVNTTSTRQVAVYNLPSTAGANLTSALHYLSLSEITAGGPLTAVLAPTSPDLPAGNGNWTLTVTASSSATGTFSDTFTLNLSDEALIPGSAGQMLTVVVDVNFVPVPEPGTVAFLLAAAGGVGFARRRRA